MMKKIYSNRAMFFLLFVVASLLVLPMGAVAGEKAEVKKTEASATQKSEKLPKLVMEEESFDFGEMLQQSKAEHVFKIKNEGNADLNIKDIKTSCGCTAAMASSSVIKPGKTGDLRIIFSSKRFNGEVHRQIRFSSNDPQKKNTTLNIKARVKALLEARPQYISFGKIIGQKVAEKTIKIKNMMAVPVTLEKVFSSDKHLAIGSYKKLLNPNESSDITFKYTPDKELITSPRGVFGNVEVTLKGQKEKVLIPFSGQLTGEIQFIPQNVGFNVVKKGKKARRKISVKNFGEKDLKVVKVEYDNKVVNTEFKTPYTVKSGESAKIILTPSSELEEGSFKSTVKIITDSKDYPEFIANVYGVVKEENVKKKETPEK